MALLGASVLTGAAQAQKDGSAGQPAISGELNTQVQQLYRAGRYAEAAETARRVLALRERQLPPDHGDVGQALVNLAAVEALQRVG
ncbi:MAG: tetratricopeptide repeat protein [Hyphomicrobiaceae bacterium]|nr:tetratricopeptide repeat protein [Hyphomicrobiaceae bacterium]